MGYEYDQAHGRHLARRSSKKNDIDTMRVLLGDDTSAGHGTTRCWNMAHLNRLVDGFAWLTTLILIFIALFRVRIMLFRLSLSRNLASLYYTPSAISFCLRVSAIVKPPPGGATFTNRCWKHHRPRLCRVIRTRSALSDHFQTTWAAVWKLPPLEDFSLGFLDIARGYSAKDFVGNDSLFTKLL